MTRRDGTGVLSRLIASTFLWRQGMIPLMRIRRQARRLFWGLWIACLVFSLWFFTEVIRLFLQAESW